LLGEITSPGARSQLSWGVRPPQAEVLTRYVLTALASLASLAACRSAPRAAAIACAPATAPDARAYTPAEWPALGGRFALTEEWTSSPDPYVTRGELTLAPVDSAEQRFRRRRVVGPRAGEPYGPERFRPLRGEYVWRVEPAPPDGRREWREPAEFEDDTLYTGYREGMDMSPTHLRVEGVSSRGFWGTWRNYQTGIGRLIDRDGRPAPDPAGRFCATRRP
jgi:hypothetical protein